MLGAIRVDLLTVGHLVIGVEDVVSRAGAARAVPERVEERCTRKYAINTWIFPTRQLNIIVERGVDLIAVSRAELAEQAARGDFHIAIRTVGTFFNRKILHVKRHIACKVVHEQRSIDVSGISIGLFLIRSIDRQAIENNIIKRSLDYSVRLSAHRTTE